MIQDALKIQIALMRVYKILKFTPDEAKGALNDMVGVQQLAVSTELLNSLTEDEAKTINEAAQKTDEAKKTAMEQIAKVRAADEGFKSRAQAAAKKALEDYIAYFKTRGDDSQKAEIAKILAGIE